MTRSLLAIALFLVLCVSVSFGQGFAANIYYGPAEGDPLTTECDGSTPLPDGRIIRIFQDTNLNGPDPEDPQPTVCDNPPQCLDGPEGTVNFNQFLTNGVATGLGEGYLWTNPATLQSFGASPPGPSWYYLRVYEPDGITVLWTSGDFYIQGGGYSEVAIPGENWTCGQGGVQCLVVDETE